MVLFTAFLVLQIWKQMENKETVSANERDFRTKHLF